MSQGTLKTLLEAPTLILGETEETQPVQPEMEENQLTQPEPVQPGGDEAPECPQAAKPMEDASECKEPAGAVKKNDPDVSSLPKIEVHGPETMERVEGTSGQDSEDVNIDRKTTVSMESQDQLEKQKTQESFPDVTGGFDEDLSKRYPSSVMGDLVLLPPALGGWESEKNALDLKTCLAPQFDTGLTPDADVLLLSKHVIQWMKQVSQTPCHTSWSSEFQEAMDAFRVMRDGSDHFVCFVKTCQSTLKALESAIADNHRKTLQDIPQGHPKRDEILAKKQQALEKWGHTRRTEVYHGLDEACATHHTESNRFDEFLKGALDKAFSEYTSELEKLCSVNEEELFAQLDNSAFEKIAADNPEMPHAWGQPEAVGHSLKVKKEPADPPCSQARLLGFHF